MTAILSQIALSINNVCILCTLDEPTRWPLQSGTTGGHRQPIEGDQR